MDVFVTAVFEAMGGARKVAQFFDVDRTTVYVWKKNGFPKARMMYLLASPKARKVVRAARLHVEAEGLRKYLEMYPGE